MKTSLKKDKYSNARDGNSHLLEISCAKCNNLLFTYQKDGDGKLFRAYLDRIIEPSIKLDSSALKCSNCQNLIGVSMIYDKEKRKAFRLIHGEFTKKRKS